MTFINLKNPYPNLNNLCDINENNPTLLCLEPTNRCNTKCTYCAHYYYNYGEDMQDNIFQKIRESLLNNIKEIDLVGGGEPLITKHFDKMLEECLKRGISVSTTSNGILLRNDEFVSRIVRSNILLRISLDGARAESFEFTRPYIKWEKMLESLECIKRNADLAGAENRFKLHFNFVVMKNNIADLPELVQLADKYGAKHILILPLGEEDKFEKVKYQSLSGSPELIFTPLLKALKLATKYNISMEIPHSFRDAVLNGKKYVKGIKKQIIHVLRKISLGLNYLRRKGLSRALQIILFGLGPTAKAGSNYCLLPWKETYITYDGKVYACCRGGDELGCLDRQEWKDIWNGSKYRNLRRTIHSWNPTTICRYCHIPAGINGGDEKQYEKYFSKYQKDGIELNSKDITFTDGFYILEWKEDGSPSHIWMGRRGTIKLPMKKNAKFIRFHIIHRHPIPLNPGKCQINNESAEPFDNTCPHITFPINNIKDDLINIRFEMENTIKIPPDPRELALAIHKIEYLF